MLIEVLKSKIHRIKVTDGNLDYIGSLTLDIDLMEKVGLISGEKIQVLNVNNGERLETYVIEGERGKGDVIEPRLLQRPQCSTCGNELVDVALLLARR